MKKNKALLLTFLLSTLLIASVVQVKAQKIELSPLIGYETGAYTYVTGGRLHAIGGMDFGGSMNVNLGGGRWAELSFTQLYSSLNYESGLITNKLSDLIIDYYSAGVLQEIKPGAKVTPYGLFTLGVVNYNPSSNTYHNENKMHVSLAGGIKINASEKVGLRLQARLLLPIYYAGGYIFAGSGGSGYGVSGGFTGIQGDFTAQLVIKLGH
jgi:hypothetical protein